MNRRFLSTLLCVSALGGQLLRAQTPAAAPAADTTNIQATNDSDALKQLRARIAEQQEQIKKLQEAVAQQQELLEKTLANTGANSVGATATAPATTTADGTAMIATAAAPNAPVKLVPAVDTTSKADVVQLPKWMQKGETVPSSPLGITIGNTVFTPIGFMDATFFSRSTNVGSGIGTNFAGIPYNNAATGHLSESNFSAQNSRIGVRVDSTYAGYKILGYLEADFLFNNNAASGYQITSNSAGFRLRNYFVDARSEHFEVMGGQDWSFLTPNRKGLSPVPSDIFYTQNMDTNYQVGLTWTRAPQFRFIYHANEDFAFGIALENPQQYVGGGSGASSVVFPSNVSSIVSAQFNTNGNSNSTNVPNWFPDIIFKGAYDGHAGGKLFHVEAAGMVTGFKDYINISTAPAIKGTHTLVGGGGEVNANLEIVKNFRLIANTYFTDGGGRYIFGIAPDVIVRSDGSISAVHAYSSVDGFEAQVSKKSLLALYWGGAYVGRDTTVDNSVAKPVLVGYGEPGATQNRYVQEITADWVQTLWKSERYGALSLINQYSYVFKEPWTYVSPAPKQAHSNMVYIDLRYTLP